MDLLDTLLGVGTSPEEASPTSPDSLVQPPDGEVGEAGDDSSEKVFPFVAADTSAPRGSVLIFSGVAGRELWIASDQSEADQLCSELADEGDGRAVIVAGDVVKLAGQPRELIDAAVRALVVLVGAKVAHVEKEPAA